MKIWAWLLQTALFFVTLHIESPLLKILEITTAAVPLKIYVFLFILLFYPSLKVAFVSPAKEIRAAGLRALRHFLQTPEQAQAVFSQRMDILIARFPFSFSFILSLVHGLRVLRVMASYAAQVMFKQAMARVALQNVS